MKLQRMDDPIAYADAAYEQAIASPPLNGQKPAPAAIDEPVEWIENDDYSKSVTLSNGMVVTFRDITGADLKFAEGLSGGNIDKMMRLACRLCIKWGDRDSVALPQLDHVRGRDIMLINRVMESFLS